MSRPHRKEVKSKVTRPGRRKLLQGLGGASGALLAGSSLPQQWTRPVIEAVMLPAHATQTGQVVVRAGGSGESDSAFLHDALDRVVPSAHAAIASDFSGCIEFEFQLDSENNILGIKIVVLQPLCVHAVGPPYTSATNVPMTGGPSIWTASNVGPDTQGRSFNITLEVTAVPISGTSNNVGSCTIELISTPTFNPFSITEGEGCEPADSNSCS